MKPTTDNTRRLFSHLRSATAQVHLLSTDLQSEGQIHGFDMGVAAAADVLDAIERELHGLQREASIFEAVNTPRTSWPVDLPELLLFRPMEPVPAIPVDGISLVAERIRGVVAVTTAALRQGDVYVYTSSVDGTLDAIAAMLAELTAMLGKVQLEEASFPASVDRPGMGPSRTWAGGAGEAAA